MEQKPPSVKWKAIGRKLAVDTTNRPTAAPIYAYDEEIEIKELDKSFTMPGYEDAPIAGKPIDAKMATFLIKRFYDSLPEIPKTIIKRGNMKKLIEYSDEELTKFEKWIINLLMFSKAITIDKNVLLKTISQPGCEGIRFYLCLKQNEPKADGTPGDPADILSLVLVGIDNKGKDLHYNFDAAVKEDINNNIFSVKSESLNSEYAYPPPPRAFNKQASEKSFILGEYAWENVFDKFIQ